MNEKKALLEQFVQFISENDKIPYVPFDIWNRSVPFGIISGVSAPELMVKQVKDLQYNTRIQSITNKQRELDMFSLKRVLFWVVITYVNAARRNQPSKLLRNLPFWQAFNIVRDWKLK